MNLKLIITTTLLGCSAFSVMAKNDHLYNLYLQKSIAIEKQYIVCSKMPENDKSDSCLVKVSQDYDNLIKAIRKSSGSSVDEKLWQRLNINFDTAKSSCGSRLTTVLPNEHYTPFSACKHAMEQVFFTTVLNLHYQ